MVKFKNRPNECIKSAGKEYWISRSVAVVAIIVAKYQDEDYVLIGERGTGAADHQGLWNVPCGYVDWDERGYDAMIREVYEETGFYIPSIEQPNELLKKTQPFFVNTDPDENRQNVSLSYGFYFKTEKLPELTSEHSEPDEVGELKWIKMTDVDKYKFAFKHEKRIEMFKDLIKLFF